MTSTFLPVLLGLATGLSLIIAIGSQNAFVLRLGLEGHNRVIVPVVAICAVSDAVLILAGVLGLGVVVAAAPVAIIVIRVLGSAFLIIYGLVAARRAIRPGALVVSGVVATTGMRVAVVSVLALTWLNPHVYLDTVLFLGAVANQQGATERWWWAGGAIAASFVWFSALGFGARLLRPMFAKPASWRVLDAVIAVVMIALGVRLALGH
ncbi:L-lysine exporter family protein LysE/ArgO [Cryobacterium flavum]|uniref:Amino acid transporter n=1 Tax=Cryobacterium flavum TaxID=1424659 RepID=A0A4R8V0L1_9MICO|nr:LysE family transporter [Cryobacterium flavum]TFB75677.1 amino acid transporter [Cryobacterium flavum]SDN80535.1 L-lysine exporter family protein LysE/ArgO [Cryobacterium flavum]